MLKENLNESLNSLTLNEKECLICLEQDADAILMDCGHGGVCYNCALEIWKASSECHLCREKIKSVYQL